MGDSAWANRWLRGLLGVALAGALVACDDGVPPMEADTDGGQNSGDTSGGGGDGEGTSGDDGEGTSGDDGDSSSGGSGNSGDSTSGGSGGGDSGDGTGGDTGDAAACPTDCDDGIDCTADECVEGQCVNRIDASACAAGESCDIAGGGCTAGSACGTESDCDFPQCSQDRMCDAASASCLYSALDSDSDGFAPSICGGGDCDDSNPRVGPGQTERCNGQDDDCDGEADDDASCPGEGQVCLDAGTEDATCGCEDDRTECANPGGAPSCVDTNDDRHNCGECGNDCGDAGECVEGECTCPEGADTCDVVVGSIRGVPITAEQCVDTQTDPQNCGGCNMDCEGGFGLCEDGACVACGGEGERCCETGVLGTGCDAWLRCDGNLGGPKSECTPCGQEVGDPCCVPPGGEEANVCTGDWFGARRGDPVCGDSGTCVAP